MAYHFLSVSAVFMAVFHRVREGSTQMCHPFLPSLTDNVANNDNRPETLLAIVDAAAAERVVRLASPVIQEERPFQLF